MLQIKWTSLFKWRFLCRSRRLPVFFFCWTGLRVIGGWPSENSLAIHQPHPHSNKSIPIVQKTHHQFQRTIWCKKSFLEIRSGRYWLVILNIFFFIFSLTWWADTSNFGRFEAAWRIYNKCSHNVKSSSNHNSSVLAVSDNVGSEALRDLRLSSWVDLWNISPHTLAKARPRWLHELYPHW